MKKNLVGIYQIFYGSVIIIGIISLTIGIFFLNIFNESSDFIIVGIDILLGVILIFISYIFYQKEMEKLSKDIYPIIFPKDVNISNTTFNPRTKSERKQNSR
jgi:drug/metabolite transporter (DMT)-like permease